MSAFGVNPRSQERTQGRTAVMVTHGEAESRVNLGFLVHLVIYLLAIAGMAVLNYTLTPDKKWALWVAGGWGAGVILHGALLCFSQTRERAINRAIARMERRNRA
jgi:hypothetical protein